MKIDVRELNESIKRYEEWRVGEFLSNSFENNPIEEVTSPKRAVSPEENLRKRKEMLATKIGQESLDFAYERAIGNNDSVYSNFIEKIDFAKKKVGRIVIQKGGKPNGYATGFMVSETVLLTNWHVFKTQESVSDSEVQFDYEYDINGNPKQPTSFKLNPDVFYHASETLDYCFVAVNTIDENGKIPLSNFGYIFLDPAFGKLANEEQELLNIIHHPEGDLKQLSIRENLFKEIHDNTIQYTTDTAPGSSGSPVFNDQFQIVALHHMSIAKTNRDDEFLDKDGRVIPRDANNKIDKSKLVWVLNEGIRISVIILDLVKTNPNPAFVAEIIRKPISTPIPAKIEDTIPTTIEKQSPQNPTQMENNNVTISFPASLMSSSGMININIDTKNTPVLAGSELQKNKLQDSTSALTFTEKASIEDTKDYSSYKGYQSKFLGVGANEIPIPLPKSNLKNLVAKIKNSDSYILKYQYYSTIQHAVRKMPVISMINIDGDANKRKDDTKREDVWLRDNRIDYDLQLSNAFYGGSGFDRGHMSRREDANWGETAEDAKAFADLTCMHTNACPQVPSLNRSNKSGLWGILEKIVLEKGAKREGQTTNDISVINGPIFKDTDRQFRGIQIPMEFFKIILWLTSDGKLKATAFKLSQSNLVDAIDFDEDLNIDKNIQIKAFQCSIKLLEELTHLDFSKIIPFDTFQPAFGSDEIMEINEESIGEHIRLNVK